MAALLKPVQYLKGVGPRRAERLKLLGVETVGDLLNHFPREHDDRTRKVPIAKARPGPAVTLQGVVEGFEVSQAGRGLLLGQAVLRDDTGAIVATWFRRASPRYDPFEGLARQLARGAPLLVHGSVDYSFRRLQIRVEEHELLRDGSNAPLHVNRLVPLYPLTEGLDARWLRELVWEALAAHAGEIADGLPEDFRKRYGLAPLSWAVRRFHFPDGWDERAEARRRLAFEEFFFLELALAGARERRSAGPPAAACAPTRAYLTPFRAALGFDFTPAQKRVINEIFADMAGDAPMNRLLQGDVGSGKTVVALSAMLLAVENGRQAALMAPTEILAEQHALTLKKFLRDLPLRWALFSRGVPKKQRLEQAERLAAGDIHIAVGTHALIEEGVAFKELGLAVVDEQHRFGVRQRAVLRGKARAPHVLTMTATPIPRTLAMTLYGDLSVSAIDELPPGRPPIVTRWTTEGEALAAVRRAVSEDGRAYVVLPLVEESEKLNLRAAVKEWERLVKIFPDVKVGLLHGRLKPEEKEKAMAAFKAGETRILAATPVIEVGIDVPEATVMVVMEADRFGLSQLHQLRGRVGRGRRASACFLVCRPTAGPAAERLRLLCRISDGFRLAEEDLKLRGPGEFLGEAQHGLPALKVGNLVTDGELIAEARRAAFDLAREDPALARPENAPFREELKRRYAGRLNLGEVA
ncbi:MAG: ATP-dependent DNA helicase RecG [Elusimicrobiota bacterium]